MRVTEGVYYVDCLNPVEMSAFTALNIEPESDSEDEIDDSKEIQIEEALKLYQNALKFHSQGPQSFDEAEEAYDALFRSEVFTYFESLSEEQRVEIYGEDSEPWSSSNEGPSVEPNADGSPSTLPQILYLAYKNRGHFILDRLKHGQLAKRTQEPSATEDTDDGEPTSKTIASSLRLLAEALNRDETDLELWRQVSRVAESLGSTRIARFCLEAVLNEDDASTDTWPESLGLQGIFATEKLGKLIRLLGDDTSECATEPLTRKQQHIIQSFKAHLDPLPYLPTPPPEPLIANCTDQGLPNQTERVEIEVPLRTWASCGKAILLQLQKEAQGQISLGSGASYSLLLPLNGPMDQSPSVGNVTADHFGDSPTTVVSHGAKAKARPDVKSEADQTKPQNLDNILQSYSESGMTRLHSNTDDLPQDTNSLNQPIAEADVEQALGQAANPEHHETRTMTLPNRKRSNEAAELDEGEDAGRSKSKRIKARTSVEEPGPRKDPLAKQLEQWQQGEFRYLDHIDEQAFEHASNMLATLGITAVASVREPKADVLLIAGPQADKDERAAVSSKEGDTLSRDLMVTLRTWTTYMSDVFLHGTGVDDPISGTAATQNSGLLVFLEQSNIRPRDDPLRAMLTGSRGLDAFAEHIRQDWMPLDQLALAWIKALLGDETFILGTQDHDISTTYDALLWPDNLKETIVQLLVKEDEFFFETFSKEVESLMESQSTIGDRLEGAVHSLTKTIQNIFELHLDIYGRITNPSSEVDLETRAGQRDRLQRWAALSHQALSWNGVLHLDAAPSNVLLIRFLWAYAVLSDLCEICSRDLVILYFQDLKRELKEIGCPIIEIQNNAVMPEVSVDATEKQISRLTTMDFFISVFNPEKDDPIALIESLEPILEKSVQQARRSVAAPLKGHLGNGASESDVTDDLDEGQANSELVASTEPHLKEMLQFLEKASLPMQLMLWRRLIDAYSVIQYPPRILLCYLRCIGLIVGYLRSPQYKEQNDGKRQKELLRWLRSLDDLLRWTIGLALTDVKSLDCMDEANLHEAMSYLASLQYILHSYVAWDDLIRTALREPPKQPNNSSSTAYSNAMDKFRDMVVKTWTLQYVLLRESAAQMTTEMSTDAEATNRNLIQYLKLTHRALGARTYCNLSNKILVRLTKHELSRIDNFVDSELEAAQIILDLYGLKICPGSKEIDDHGCVAENLDRQDAIEIMDRVLIQANRLHIKDLIKSELKTAIEKMQQVIKVPKITPSSPLKCNQDIINQFLSSPINPLDLYRSLRGIGELHFRTVTSESHQIAQKGWFFLHGYMALCKFRSQKWTSLAPTTDLDVAMVFLRHELDQGLDRWETWYRLAQVYDAKIEADTTWSADELNNAPEGLVTLQRNAIHCYSMAVAAAERCEDPSFDMFQKLADLYSDFGIRIYSSSRQPFSMEAFSVEKFMKHFSSLRQGMYQGQPFKPVNLYGAWKYAATLLHRSLVHKPDSWVTWYMLGKSVWKMHNCHESVLCGDVRQGHQLAIIAFKTAIEKLPSNRDNRHPEKDPILEPHYKLVSIVHKSVSSEKVGVETGCEILESTPYARRVPPVQDLDDWEGYILHVLKVLRSADKANWHHRMVLRAARTIYDGSPNDRLSTLGAKSELTQQIFTKTMTIQVWKPEHERTGRHFVYTSRYVQFFLRLLFELKDRASIEALGRQVRKKPGKFFQHGYLWHEFCMTHLMMLRNQCLVPHELSDSIFKNISHDLFVQNADRLESWAHLPSTESPMIDLLKEAIELKKTNGNLMKPAVIEDLIADVYAHLHQMVVPELIARSNEEESRGRMRVDHLMNVENPAASTPSPDPAGKPEDAAPTRQRIRGVGRREIQKRAEALTNKPAPPQTVAKTPETPPPDNEPPTPRSTIQVVIKQNMQSKDSSSVPGSVHDSADDESELSEVEETFDTAQTRPMFPGLAAKEATEDGEEEEIQEENQEENEEGDGDSVTLEDDDQLEEVEEQDGTVDGEETYHTPMEM
ncbi:MAG: hypothetical protein Q9218_005638 [Villophora microphyllina]